MIFLSRNCLSLFASSLALATALSGAAHAQPGKAQPDFINAEAVTEDAWDWWARASNLYELGYHPQPGAVMAFSTLERGQTGHIAVVSHMVNDREIVVRVANWLEPEKEAGAYSAIDISAAGDWSQVKFRYRTDAGISEEVSFVLGFLYGQRLRAIRGGAII